MTSNDWIGEFERYLLLVKNRAAMTASSYVTDVELLHKFLKVDDWAAVTEDMAVDYMAHLRKKREPSCLPPLVRYSHVGRRG